MERILGARLVYAKGSMARALSFEYLNRQLVWHELSELLLFLLPLLNVARLKSMVRSYLPQMIPSLETSAAEGEPLKTFFPLLLKAFGSPACGRWLNAHGLSLM